jgi:glycosyltransferase involved in cell wall biosynthesis
MLIGLDANEANVANRLGSNQFAYQILCQLAKLDRKNSYRIYLKSQPLGHLPPPTKTWQYRVLKPAKFWTQWRLPLDLYFHRPRPDVLLTLGHYAPRFSPVPSIISIMDLAFLKFPQSFLKKDLHQLKSWTRYSAKKASHIFTISNHSKKDIQKFYQLAEGKITVIYPGIDHQRFSRKITPLQINKVKQKYHIANEYLLYLGTLQPRKNLLNLIKAYSQLIHRYPKLLLVLAGKKGWLYQSLFTEVKRLKLNHQVVFTGFVAEADTPALIKGARLFILPSLYEGFGIPVVQAMASATPVLVSQNSSLPEIVADCGNYIQPPFGQNEISQGIEKALSLPSEKQQQLVLAAQKRAQQFTWEAAAKTILTVLHHNI